MTYPPHLREKARQLRRDKRLTIDQIADRLAVSRTTAYYWVGDITIPLTTKQNAAQQRATRRMQERCLRDRELSYNAARHCFHAMSDWDPSFRDFICLYIGEGSKRCRNTVAVANSDPIVVGLAFRWLTLLSRNPVACWVHYHADQNLSMLRGFWANRLGVEPDDIRLQRKSNSGGLSGRTWRCRFGVLTVRTSDTQLRARLEGWMDEMKGAWLDSTQPRGVAKSGIAFGLGPKDPRFKSGRPDLVGSKTPAAASA